MPSGVAAIYPGVDIAQGVGKAPTGTATAGADQSGTDEHFATARLTGTDPAMFALTVAISTSNSFVIPTRQVNALILGARDYGVRDFLRVGGPITVLYLVVSLAASNLLY